MATLSALEVYPKLRRIAELAKDHPERVFTSLAHCIDRDFLYEAYRLTRKKSAPGVDGQTAADYRQDLSRNLTELSERFHTGSYRAPPVKRVYIPKDGGKKRPLGLPTFEDKVLQRAVTMVLTAVYEQDFLDCSYGCRPGRSAHQALGALREGIRNMQGGWVLDVDIQGFFDHLAHKALRDILDQRVRDGVLRRAIHKWLKAGILEDGVLRSPTAGTPQGGVISPLLANIYLHTVVDRWFHEDLLPRLRGQAFLVRYVDDVVMVFSNRNDAQRVHEALPKRLARFGLTLHPGEDAAGPLPTGLSDTTPRFRSIGPSGGDLRLSRLHALLGSVPQPAMGHQAQDEQEPLSPGTQGALAVVSREPSPADRRAARHPDSEASRSLQLLRRGRQQPRGLQGEVARRTHLEALAWPAQSASTDDLGGVSEAAGSLAASQPCHLCKSRSEPVARGAGCGSPARPDL